MKKIKYNMQIGSTSAYMNSIMEAKKGVGQRDLKRYTKDYFLFDSQFGSKRSTEVVMDVVFDMIGMVKINTIYYGDIVSTIRSIHFYISTSCSTQGSTVSYLTVKVALSLASTFMVYNSSYQHTY